MSRTMVLSIFVGIVLIFMERNDEDKISMHYC